MLQCPPMGDASQFPTPPVLIESFTFLPIQSVPVIGIVSVTLVGDETKAEEDSE